jgi:hypothetical protein
VFENRVQRRIFGQKGDEVMGGWRKLHIEELRDLFSSPSIIRKIKSRKRSSMNGEKRNAYNFLLGKAEGMCPPGRTRCKWADNIKIYLGETGRLV